MKYFTVRARVGEALMFADPRQFTDSDSRAERLIAQFGGQAMTNATRP